jgi:hypothetical protein
MVGGDEHAPSERAFETVEQRREPFGAFEVAAVKDQAGGASVSEQPDVLIAKVGAGQADHQPLAHEVRQLRHSAILAIPPGRAVTLWERL